jgi:hypothetical protein
MQDDDNRGILYPDRENFRDYVRMRNRLHRRRAPNRLRAQCDGCR